MKYKREIDFTKQKKRRKRNKYKKSIEWKEKKLNGDVEQKIL